MRAFVIGHLPALLLGGICSSIVACAHAPARAAASPREELARIAAEIDGRVAVTVLDLRTGERVSVRGDVRHPMMSVFKLPLAVAAFVDIEAGLLRLDQRVPIVESELRQVSPIAEAWRRGERAPTLESMLAHMIQDSDNTVGDKLVPMLGGGAAVTARLRKLGVEGITITGPELPRQAALFCVGAPEPAGGWTLATVDACPRPAPEAQAAALRREIEAPPDHATTDALVDLLARLDRGTILGSRSRAWLLSTLAGTRTGLARLPALLPAGTPVAHKTGSGVTVQGVTLAVNDAGIVTMPGGGRFAIAVLIAGSRAPFAVEEAIIARLARATWERLAR